MFIEVKVRRNEISVQNRFDSMEAIAKKKTQNKEQQMQIY